MEDKVTIVETSPRDGLPILPGGKSAKSKIFFINRLVETGFKKIECVAFIHPRDIPENADAEKVVAGITKKAGVSYAGLIQTEVGCRRALSTDIDEIVTIVAASDEYNRAFRGSTLRQTLNSTLPFIFDAVKSSGKATRIYVATAFGCPYSGEVPYTDVVNLILKLAHMGANEVVLVDSGGLANPRKVRELVEMCIGLQLTIPLAVHFNNNRGMGMANYLSAYDAGARIFDASLGGLSKTPFASAKLPLGYWNIPTEDLVYMLETMGIKTNIDLNRLLDCVKLAEVYARKALPGHMLRATEAVGDYKASKVIKVLS